MEESEERQKRCPKCNTLQPLSQFHKDATRKDGYQCYCKSCTVVMKLKYREIKRERLKEQRRARYESNKELILNRNKKWRDENKEKVLALNHQYYSVNKKQLLVASRNWANSASHSENRLARLPGVDRAVMTENGIEVRCKKCSVRFIPNNKEINSRIRAVEGFVGGESNFYCSDACRNSCPLYWLQPNEGDPMVKGEREKVRSCQTKHLKSLQCDEAGHNYCERCGDIIDVELHHTNPVSACGELAINSAGHILLCAGCHTAEHS